MYIFKMIVRCPITGKTYERLDATAYHDDDCPYCEQETEQHDDE